MLLLLSLRILAKNAILENKNISIWIPFCLSKNVIYRQWQIMQIMSKRQIWTKRWKRRSIDSGFIIFIVHNTINTVCLSFSYENDKIHNNKLPLHETCIVCIDMNSLCNLYLKLHIIRDILVKQYSIQNMLNSFQGLQRFYCQSNLLVLWEKIEV